LDPSIEWFEKALEENPRDWIAMRNKGVSLSKRGDDRAAIEWFGKALNENPEDSQSYRDWSLSAISTGKLDEGFEKICRAAELEPEEWQSDFRAVCKICDKDPDEEWGKLFPDFIPEEPPPEQLLGELSTFIEQIHRALGKEAKGYLREKKKEEEKRNRFLRPDSRLDTSRSLLMVLRRWNSYTPALPTDNDERSCGGGYFLWHKGHGTVIDPGYDFIDNFDQAGCAICDIDNVILTHAHNDHTIDFESLLTLFHEFNDRQRAEKWPCKQVRFFLNNGAFKKFAGLLNLRDHDYTERIITLNPGNECELLGGGRFQVMPAYHDELVARDQAIGLFFHLPVGDQQRTLLMTSDTGLFPLKPDVAKLTPNTSDEKAEVWQRYLDAGAKDPDVMVIHIGSIHPDELKTDAARDPAKACYLNHLGLIGTARVIAMCRPKLAVISEFGEEMRPFRTKLIETLQEKLLDYLFRHEAQPRTPRAVPGDLALIYDLGAETFYDCVSDTWEPAESVSFAEGGTEDRQGIYYFAAKHKEKFTQRPKDYVKPFKAVRESMRRMYFRPVE